VKPAPFAYVAPRTLDEVVAQFAEHGDEAKALAGGQSLVPMMAFRLATPGLLVDLNGVSDLDHQRLDGDTLTLGALTRHRTAGSLPGLAERCPMLTEAIGLIGHPAIRNRGTVGGSLAHADPSAEWPALILALDGEVDAVGPNGRRTIPAAEFLDSYFTTSLLPEEVLTEVRVRLPNGGRTGSAFVELARRHGDFAIAGVGAVLSLDAEGRVAEARIALTGVRDRAVRAQGAEDALRGAEPTDDVLSAAAEALDPDLDPPSDVHGSSEYRRHVAKVLARRALARARDRASGEVAA
jgi:aerobic carbon-monoxide dehydrogenase medium subunit